MNNYCEIDSESTSPLAQLDWEANDAVIRKELQELMGHLKRSMQNGRMGAAINDEIIDYLSENKHRLLENGPRVLADMRIARVNSIIELLNGTKPGTERYEELLDLAARHFHHSSTEQHTMVDEHERAHYEARNRVNQPILGKDILPFVQPDNAITSEELQPALMSEA